MAGFLGMRGSGDFTVSGQRPKNWREMILYLYPNGDAPLTAILAKMASDLNNRDKDLIAKAGKAKIQQLSKEDVAAWRKAMEPVWKKFEGDIGRDLIDAALKSNK